MTSKPFIVYVVDGRRCCPRRRADIPSVPWLCGGDLCHLRAVALLFKTGRFYGHHEGDTQTYRGIAARLKEPEQRLGGRAGDNYR